MVQREKTASTGKKASAVQDEAKEGRIQVRLPPDMKAELDKAALEEERDLSFLARKAIREWLDRRRKP